MLSSSLLSIHAVNVNSDSVQKGLLALTSTSAESGPFAWLGGGASLGNSKPIQVRIGYC
jgi:hypothetical protein